MYTVLTIKFYANIFCAGISEKKSSTSDEEKRINIIIATRRQMELREREKPEIFQLLGYSFIKTNLHYL